MKLLLLYLALVACGAAYYEYTWQQQTAVGFPMQIEALQRQADTLAAANKKLIDDKAVLTQQLTNQLHQVEMLKATQAPVTTAAQWQVASHGVPLAQAVPMGTLTTLVGKTYQNCQLLKVGISDITISSDQGITQIPITFLPPDWQKRMGYDPQKAEALKQAEIRYQEQLRESNGPPPGP